MSILILGDGLLGSELEKQTGWDLISRRRNNFNLVFFESYIDSKYTTIINCIANTDSYSENKEEHMKVNYEFPKRLSDYCIKKNIKLIHISTEFVYANNIVPPTELEREIPDDTWYAKSKLLADNYINLTNRNSLICRESHKPYPFPYNEVWRIQTSGDTVDKISSILIHLIKKDAVGIYNVGTGSKWLWEIAPKSKVVDPPPYVPKDTRMNLNKLNNFLNNKL